MKKLLVGLLSLLSITAFATMDFNGNVFILSQHIQSGEYFVQKAPILGCVGLPKGPELAQLTREYIVPSNVGCGKIFNDNINALSCAKVISSRESADYMTFAEITLDISNCYDKDSEEFIDGVKKVVKMNFATESTPEPKLTIVK